VIVSKYSLLQMQIVLLRQKMAQQRVFFEKKIGQQKETDQFQRSLCMRFLQQHLSIVFPWLMVLKNKLQGRESALFWSVALLLGQHWLQRKNKTQE